MFCCKNALVLSNRTWSIMLGVGHEHASTPWQHALHELPHMCSFYFYLDKSDTPTRPILLNRPLLQEMFPKRGETLPVGQEGWWCCPGGRMWSLETSKISNCLMHELSPWRIKRPFQRNTILVPFDLPSRAHDELEAQIEPARRVSV